MKKILLAQHYSVLVSRMQSDAESNVMLIYVCVFVEGCRTVSD